MLGRLGIGQARGRIFVRPYLYSAVLFSSKSQDNLVPALPVDPSLPHQGSRGVRSCGFGG